MYASCGDFRLRLGDIYMYIFVVYLFPVLRFSWQVLENQQPLENKIPGKFCRAEVGKIGLEFFFCVCRDRHRVGAEACGVFQPQPGGEVR